MPAQDRIAVRRVDHCRAIAGITVDRHDGEPARLDGDVRVAGVVQVVGVAGRRLALRSRLGMGERRQGAPATGGACQEAHFVAYRGLSPTAE
ncbi:MAG: hypothetical protein U1E67_00180 [Hyphomicrobiales bacterium]